MLLQYTVCKYVLVNCQLQGVKLCVFPQVNSPGLRYNIGRSGNLLILNFNIKVDVSKQVIFS